MDDRKREDDRHDIGAYRLTQSRRSAGRLIHNACDAAVGVPWESIGTVAEAGAVNVILGSATGLTATGNQFWSQNSSGVLDTAEAGDQLGCEDFYLCPYW